MEQRKKQSQPLQTGTPTTTPADGAGVDDGRERAGKWTVLAVTSIGVFMATLDASIVNISLPTMARYFNVPLSGAVEWVIISYLVVTAAIMLTAGRLADMIGRKVVWVAGLAGFTLGSLLCGLSPSLGFLIAARAIQGLGGALLMAVSPAMLTAAFPAYQRGRALGINGVVVAMGISTGPTLGGLITAYFSWHWIFLVNVPIGIIGIIFSLRILTEKMRRNPGRFDPLGALLLAIGLSGVTAGLSFGQEMGWSSFPILAALIVGVLALIMLPLVEMRVSNPIIQFQLVYNRVFVSGISSALLSFLSLTAVGFLMPFYFVELRSFSTVQAGLMLTAMPLTLAVIAPFSGMLADRIGSRGLAALGLGSASVGLVLISMLNEQSSIGDIIWRLILLGFGMAVFQSPNSSAIMGSVPPANQGSASGFLATSRVMGQSLSIAMAGAIFMSLGGAAAGAALTQHPTGAQLLADQQTFLFAFRTTMLVCATLAATGVVTSLIRGQQSGRGALETAS